MKGGHIAAEQRTMQSDPQQRLLIGYYWVFRRKG
jgi:hypothetical protein